MKDFDFKECQRCLPAKSQHPLATLKLTEAAELAACRRGEMNFPGIGRPADL